MAELRAPSSLSTERNGSASNTDVDKQKLNQLSQNGTKKTGSAESRMLVLAETIRAETQKLHAYLESNGIAQPDLSVDAPDDFPTLPNEIQESRQKIFLASRELTDIVRGPRETVRYAVWSYLDTLSLQLINSYGIAKLVPLDAPIKLTELQSKTPLEPVHLARALRHAMTNNIFREPSPGYIAHTSSSRILAQDPALQAWVGFNSEDVFPAAGHVLQALRDHPQAISSTHAGFNYAFNTVGQEPMFATLGKDLARAKRFAQAMHSFSHGEGYKVSYFVDNYDLSEVDKRGGTFVDIGGSHGFVSVELAKRWKNMKFIVEDLPKTIESAPQPISDDKTVADRISLQAHDFFQEQPVKGADVYFFRWIIHNHAKPYAVSILRNLIPALKPGARVIINDYCIREAGSENAWDEKLLRNMDMIMGAILNAQEREEWEFRELFEAADPRFKFKGVQRVENCKMSVIEAVWDE
ncbi:chlorophenol O-methyltransferase [Trichoderma citrinoviride]|uniref:Chlorophenol O-methyltransferase n=1 Tax=Trichoderma citrinoviride TaxID=58853 RepID=A0A2T4AX18_9HYPO|nr:chlorophenol O-methyltransferase [Trichoderma citrinoviride]PTB61589.1 chlorophenol O-methyltransferase [Trichoderma citrinoviride]